MKQAQELINQSVQQFQEFTKNPEKAFRDFQNAQQAFLKEVQLVAQAAPAKTQEYFKKQQEEIIELQKSLGDSLKQTPADWQNIGKIWFDFQTKQFNSYLEEVKEQNEVFQKLVAHFAKEIPSETVEKTETKRKTK